MRTKRRRKRAAQWRGKPLPATEIGERWSIDFISDQLAEGRRFRVFTAVDQVSREAVCIQVAQSLPAEAVTATLDRAIAEYGQPEAITLDNGPELVAKELVEWLAAQGIKTHHIDPGSPWQNASGESFHATLRRECLSREFFHTVLEAQVQIERWRRRYNERRPHSSLGYLTPVEFRDGARIPLLERGRPSTHQDRKRRNGDRSLYLQVVHS